MICKIPNRGTLIDNYLSRNLSTDKAEKFEEHYFDCDICSKEVKFRQELKSLIKVEAEELLNRLSQEKTLIEKIKAYIAKFIDSIPRKPILIPVLAVVLIVFLVGPGSFLVDTLTKDPLSEFVYGDKVPYEYTGSGFRGTDTRPETDPELRTFHRQYRLAMSDYVVYNYAGAITICEQLEPTASEFLTRLNNKEILTEIRDYYFYCGVSHLALGRSEKLGEEEKAENFDSAIPYLQEAERIALDNSLENSDREVYYLGLTYGFDGRQGKAIEQFKRIEIKSLFYEKSMNLIKEWSE